MRLTTSRPGLPRRAATVLACAALFAAPAAQAAWEPTKPVEFIVPAGTGGGADQMARLIQGVGRQAQPDEAAAGGRQQVRRRRRRGLPRHQGRQGRPAQDRHHAVQPVHHAAGHRRAVQLARHDAGGDDGARQLRAVGQRRDAVQDRQGVPRRGQGRGPRASSRWAAPAPSRKTRSSPSASRRPPAPSSSTCPFKGGGDVAVQLVGKHIDSTREQPDRGGGAVARRQAARRCACSTTTRMPYKNKITDTQSWDDVPDLQGSRRADRLHDAARHLHAARRDARPGRSSTSTC